MIMLAEFAGGIVIAIGVLLFIVLQQATISLARRSARRAAGVTAS